MKNSMLPHVELYYGMMALYDTISIAEFDIQNIQYPLKFAVFLQFFSLLAVYVIDYQQQAEKFHTLNHETPFKITTHHPK